MAESRVRLTKVDLVARWENALTTVDCPICHVSLQSCCVECLVEERSLEECSVSVGACTHTFHSHCISRWLSSSSAKSKNCPQCQQPFDVAKIVQNSA